MSLRFFSLIVFALSSLTSWAKAPSCNTWLNGFTVYEEKVNGQIVSRHSPFELVNWDPNSQYEGVILVKPVTGNPTLEFDFCKSRNKTTGECKTAIVRRETYSNLLPFEYDPKVRQFDDCRPNEFFTFDHAGTYRVTLRSDGQVICQDVFSYSLGH